MCRAAPTFAARSIAEHRSFCVCDACRRCALMRADVRDLRAGTCACGARCRIPKPCSSAVLQVRGLLQLFFDIEHTDRHNTFFEKFTTRYKAGEILCEHTSPFPKLSNPGLAACGA